MAKRSLSSSPRLFTVDSANRTLPLVSAIVADLAPLAQDAAGKDAALVAAGKPSAPVSGRWSTIGTLRKGTRTLMN